jgi:hypothetical protein
MKIFGRQSLFIKSFEKNMFSWIFITLPLVDFPRESKTWEKYENSKKKRE